MRPSAVLLCCLFVLSCMCSDGQHDFLVIYGGHNSDTTPPTEIQGCWWVTRPSTRVQVRGRPTSDTFMEHALKPLGLKLEKIPKLLSANVLWNELASIGLTIFDYLFSDGSVRKDPPTSQQITNVRSKISETYKLLVPTLRDSSITLDVWEKQLADLVLPEVYYRDVGREQGTLILNRDSLCEEDIREFLKEITHAELAISTRIVGMQIGKIGDYLFLTSRPSLAVCTNFPLVDPKQKNALTSLLGASHLLEGFHELESGLKADEKNCSHGGHLNYEHRFQFYSRAEVPGAGWCLVTDEHGCAVTVQVSRDAVIETLKHIVSDSSCQQTAKE